MDGLRIIEIARAASYKAAAKHDALKIVGARSEIEAETQAAMIDGPGERMKLDCRK